MPRLWSERTHTMVLWYTLLTALAVAVAAIMGASCRVQAQTDDGMLNIDQLHIYLMPVDDAVVVSETYLLGNAGTEPYSGDPGSGVTVVFPLPEGASRAQVDGMSDRFEIRADAIADTHPIAPGKATTEVRFSYALPLVTDAFIRREVPLSMDAAVILVAGEGWRLDGETLVDRGPMVVGETTAQAYTVGSLAAGEDLAFRLVAVSATAPGATTGSSVHPRDGWSLGLGVFSVVVAAVIAFLLWQPGPVPELPEALRDRVLALVILDQQHQSGDLDTESYRAQRAVLKRAILDHLEVHHADD